MQIIGCCEAARTSEPITTGIESLTWCDSASHPRRGVPGRPCTGVSNAVSSCHTRSYAIANHLCAQPFPKPLALRLPPGRYGISCSPSSCECGWCSEAGETICRELCMWRVAAPRPIGLGDGSRGRETVMVDGQRPGPGMLPVGRTGVVPFACCLSESLPHWVIVDVTHRLKQGIDFGDIPNRTHRPFARSDRAAPAGRLPRDIIPPGYAP